MQTTDILILAFAVFLFAGTIKGLVGIGLPTASIGLLAQVIDPRHAIALLLIPAIITNAWQVYRSGYFREGIRRLWPFGLTLMITIWLFALLASRVPANTLVLGIGCVIVLFVLNNFFGRPVRIPERLDRPAQVIAGAIAGGMGGLTSIWAPPMVVYLLGRNFPKEVFVGATGLLIFAGTLPLMAGYWQSGLMNPTLAAHSALMVLPTWLGFAIGEKLRSWLDGDQFRNVVLIVFLLMGLNLIRQVIF